MDPDTERFLERWHAVVADPDGEGKDALRSLLQEDATIGPPPYWERFEGIDAVGELLWIVIHTIGDFTYHREWVEGPELALEFTGRVGDTQLQGIDLISLGQEGRLKKIDVMIRPANAVEGLRERVAPQMTAFLAERAEA